jgi:hypothetical protein
MKTKLNFLALFCAVVLMALAVFTFAAGQSPVYAQDSGDNFINLADTAGATSGEGWSFASNVYTITGDVEITGATTTRRVVVQSGAEVNVTLNQTTITTTGIINPFSIEANATVNLTLTGENALNNNSTAANLHVPQNATLVITSQSTRGGGLTRQE